MNLTNKVALGLVLIMTVIMGVRPAGASLSTDSAIEMSDASYVAIENLKVGSNVKVYQVDATSQQLSTQVLSVDQIYSGRTESLLEIKTADGESIRVTNEQPFLLSNGAFKKAKRLTLSDTLKCADGTTVAISSIVQVPYNDRVYLPVVVGSSGDHLLNVEGLLVGDGDLQNQIRD